MSLATDECLDDRPPIVGKEGPVGSSTVGTAVAALQHELPGQLLRKRREERGLTLEDLSRTTKISKSTLAALESSDVMHLPAAIYTRGFVKAVAHEVGLDPDATADEYLRRIEPYRGQHLLVDDGLLPPLTHGAHPVDANGDAQSLLAVNQARRFGWLTIAAAAVGLVIYLASSPQRKDQTVSGGGDESARATEAREAARPDDAARAAGDSATRAADAATAAFGNAPLRLELVTQGDCWVSVSVDGERVLARLFTAGERQSLDIGREAVLRVGQPAALSWSINGQPARRLGAAGQAVTVRITKENFRDFLSS